MTEFSDPRLAACNDHLPELLRRVVPEGEARAARIVAVVKPDDRYSCECRAPADWFVRIYLPEPAEAAP